MKNIKKLFAVTMIVGTMFSSGIIASARQLYRDVPEDSDLAPIVELLYNLSIMWGYG